MLHYVVLCCPMLRYVAPRCAMLPYVAYVVLSLGLIIATFQRNIVRHVMLRRVAMCCDMLDVVGSNLKMVKFFTKHLWMLHDVVVLWADSYNNVAPGHVG